MAKYKVKTSNAFKHLQQRVEIAAFVLFASVIRFVAENVFTVFVSSQPCATGLQQFSSKIFSPHVTVIGKVLTSSLGASAPVLGWYGKDFRSRIAYNEYVADPGFVETSVQMPAVNYLSTALMKKRIHEVKFHLKATRMASDEPEMAEYLRKKGLMDVDVATMHAGWTAVTFEKFMKTDVNWKDWQRPSGQLIASIGKFKRI